MFGYLAVDFVLFIQDVWGYIIDYYLVIKL